MLLENGVTIWQETLEAGGPPVETYYILTEEGDNILSENDDFLVTEEAP